MRLHALLICGLAAWLATAAPVTEPSHDEPMLQRAVTWPLPPQDAPRNSNMTATTLLTGYYKKRSLKSCPEQTPKNLWSTWMMPWKSGPLCKEPYNPDEPADTKADKKGIQKAETNVDKKGNQKGNQKADKKADKKTNQKADGDPAEATPTKKNDDCAPTGSCRAKKTENDDGDNDNNDNNSTTTNGTNGYNNGSGNKINMGSTVTESEVNNSTVNDSIISNSTVSFSRVEDAAVINATVDHSTIVEGATVSGGVLEDTTVGSKSSVSGDGTIVSDADVLEGSAVAGDSDVVDSDVVGGSSVVGNSVVADDSRVAEGSVVASNSTVVGSTVLSKRGKPYMPLEAKIVVCIVFLPLCPLAVFVDNDVKTDISQPPPKNKRTDSAVATTTAEGGLFKRKWTTPKKVLCGIFFIFCITDETKKKRDWEGFGILPPVLWKIVKEWKRSDAPASTVEGTKQKRDWEGFRILPPVLWKIITEWKRSVLPESGSQLAETTTPPPAEPRAVEESMMTKRDYRDRYFMHPHFPILPALPRN